MTMTADTETADVVFGEFDEALYVLTSTPFGNEDRKYAAELIANTAGFLSGRGMAVLSHTVACTGWAGSRSYRRELGARAPRAMRVSRALHCIASEELSVVSDAVHKGVMASLRQADLDEVHGRDFRRDYDSDKVHAALDNAILGLLADDRLPDADRDALLAPWRALTGETV